MQGRGVGETLQAAMRLVLVDVQKKLLAARSQATQGKP